jgi:4-hydroxy-3-polyprenylbenzoate decarboxylase
MAYKNLQEFIHTLEDEGELVRIKEFVDPVLEITEVYDRVVKHQGPALLFENTGTDFPLLINMMGTERRMCKVLGVDELDDVSKDIEQLMQQLMKPKDNIIQKLKMLPKLGEMSSWMPKVKNKRGACQQVVMEEPDITEFPIQKCWPEDGGRFLTLPIIHTRDPNTGIRNVGLYRMQVFGPQLTAMHWHRHKVSAQHFNEYKKRGEKMPVAVALGGDPVYTYASTAPMPENIDEYMLAGFLRKQRVELVPCLTNDMQVPADADIVIEGYIDPNEDYILEGPFGDHTGYYSLADYYPKFHITAITHRRDAVYPATAVGIPPQEDGWIGKATERIFLAPIKMTMVPEIKDMELPVEGVFHNLTISQIEKNYPGQAQKVTNAMWGAGQMMFNKMMIIVDGEVDIHNYKEVARYISDHVDPQTDIYFGQGPMDVLDHSCNSMGYGSKMCIDATQKHPEEKRSPNLPEPDLTSVNIDKKALQSDYPEIQGINDELVDEGISVVFISVEKNRKNHIKELTHQLFDREALQQIKALIFLEHTVDLDFMNDIIWRFANNIDPRRDSYIVEAPDKSHISHIGIDATQKTKTYDDFERDWPNIIVMDETTSKKIDKKWDKLGLGKFLESPSDRYRKQLYNKGAIAKEEQIS